ncbi:hypothetical protein HWC35_gp062 [Vibrio phage USC-1]|uniref:Uncharacterized protein n=2 Tax=Aphroditevirus USC1 TaxID=2846605 RepID=A0A514A2K2_9CAUD|nr:hypothetical protein HWC35_gp062 [Vibrio phage USC-1]QCW23272.1 hypothetical protein [Vibrio phage 5 TSL-2019]QDH47456.1 hypothetical protein [Vibrio phage USC-1]
MSLVGELQTPFFKELYQHLNKLTYTLEDFEDPYLYQNLQQQLTSDLFRILRPHVIPRPDIRDKYRNADLRVHIHLTPYEVHYCVKPVVLDLAWDLMEASLPQEVTPPEPSDELPFN